MRQLTNKFICLFIYLFINKQTNKTRKDMHWYENGSDVGLKTLFEEITTIFVKMISLAIYAKIPYVSVSLSNWIWISEGNTQLLQVELFYISTAKYLWQSMQLVHSWQMITPQLFQYSRRWQWNKWPNCPYIWWQSEYFS